ncbi:MAG: restriction endonuclease subunit S [Eubacterium sp.]|nr:restriction endonuclease subunit S [Eubacterium sp.]
MITDQIDRMRTGSAQPQLPIKVMNSLLIPIPSVEEQIIIVDYIQSMMNKEEQVKTTIASVVESIDTMKKTILAKAFRGELGTNDPEDESAVSIIQSIVES